MTEGQVRYQTLVENQRHNLEVERYNARQAKAKEKEVGVSEREVAMKEVKLPSELKLLQQQTSAAESQWLLNDFKAAESFFSSIQKGASAIGFIARALFS